MEKPPSADLSLRQPPFEMTAWGHVAGIWVGALYLADDKVGDIVAFFIFAPWGAVAGGLASVIAGLTVLRERGQGSPSE